MSIEFGPTPAGPSAPRVVVVGAGLAGSTAALRARQLGAAVLLVDKSPDASAGGNTRLSGGNLHAVSLALDDDPALIRSRIETRMDGEADPELADAYAGSTARALAWLIDAGVELDRTPRGGLARTKFVPSRSLGDLDDWPGRGPHRALITLHRAIKSRGGSVSGGATAVELIPGLDGGVAGVVVSFGGRRHDVAADAVVLCDGGFQANQDLLVRHIGPAADRIKLRGSPSGTGDALALAEPFGADLVRMRYFYGHLLHRDALTDDRLWPAPLLDTLLPHGIVVSGAGRRVVDEGLGGIGVANELSRRPDPREHWIVLDDAGWRRALEQEELDAPPFPMPAGSLEARGGRVVHGETVETLAEAIGAGGGPLAAQITDFNSASSAGTGDRLPVPRTRAAALIGRAPFHAVPVVPGITFTMGGLSIDGHARVLRPDGGPIPGLYAAGGSSGGLQGSRGPEGGYVGGLSPALVFGLQAGEHITRGRR